MSEDSGRNRRLLLATDLDGTLFRSERDRRPGDTAVDTAHGRACAFMSAESAEYLRRLQRTAVLVPVTTRSIEQYRRICWPDGCQPQLAVVANGGVLLREGSPDPEWSEEMAGACAEYGERMAEIAAQIRLLPGVRRCRISDRMFVSASFALPAQVRRASDMLDARPLQQFASGRKLYLLPPGLNKGAAVRRLRLRLETAESLSLLVGAGDSALDLPLLHEADVAIAPVELARQLSGRERIFAAPSRSNMPEFVLKTAMKLALSVQLQTEEGTAPPDAAGP